MGARWSSSENRAPRVLMQGLDNAGKTTALYKLKLGEVGCALSHHGAWQLTAAHGAPVLVLEDDVAFAPDFAALLLLALREVDALVAEGLTQPPDLLYVARRAT